MIERSLRNGRETVWEPLSSEYAAAAVCHDLTVEASKGKLRKIFGRDRELDMLETLVVWPGNHNLLVTGAPGVGKTALVEGLAQRIVAGTCLPDLNGRRVLKTSFDDMYSASANSNLPWSKQKWYLNQLIEETEEFGFILFYDNFHTVQTYPVSTPILRDALQRPEIRIIAACESGKLRSFSQKNKSMVSHFVNVDLQESSPHDTATILLERVRATMDKVDEQTVEVIRYTVELARTHIPFVSDPARSIMLSDRALLSKAFEGDNSPLSKDDIPKALSKIVNLPLESILTPKERILAMEEFLNHRILGQHDAIHRICNRLIVTKSKTAVDPHRPDGVFLLVGPTGVGKTELARALCEYLTGDVENLIRLDMSAYADPGTVRNLLGQPGAGNELDKEFEMPLFTRQVLERPHTVLLLDEIEKACKEVQLLFLHGMDTGRMQDNAGNIICLSNITVVMTSNVGFSTQRAIIASFGVGKEELVAASEREIMKAVKEFFPPEFLGRIDEIIFFKPLTPEIMRGFVGQKIEGLSKSFEKKLNVSDAAVQLIIDKGFTMEFGARQLNRAVDRILGYPLALFRTQSDWNNVRVIHVDRIPNSRELRVYGEPDEEEKPRAT